jgi:hypothetical protein
MAPLAQKVARPHPGLLPQEKGQKKSVLHPLKLDSPTVKSLAKTTPAPSEIG